MTLSIQMAAMLLHNETQHRNHCQKPHGLICQSVHPAAGKQRVIDICCTCIVTDTTASRDSAAAVHGRGGKTPASRGIPPDPSEVLAQKQKPLQTLLECAEH